MNKVRINLEISKGLSDELNRISDETGYTLASIFRQGIAFLKIAREAKQNGKHIGFASDPAKLDTEITFV